ncbi:hypothetical protein HK102_001728, partial [Quaeritorhiza haematococci]
FTFCIMLTAQQKYVPPHKRRQQQHSSSIPQDAGPSSIDAQKHTLLAPPDDIDFLHKHLYLTSPLLRELHRAKKEFEADPLVDKMFSNNRAHSVPAAPSPRGGTVFEKQFYSALEQVDAKTGGTIKAGRFEKFLDLGAAPGGFSRYLLESNPLAKGVGVTLPAEDGGLPLVIDSSPVLSDPTRYKWIARDVTDHPEDIRFDFNEQDPAPRSTSVELVDLVVAGCIYRDHETSDPNRSSPPTRDSTIPRQRLTVSQLLCALLNLSQGGTLVMVSNTKPFLLHIEVLVLLRSLFTQLTPVKPTVLHTVRSSYYLVAAEFDRSKAETDGVFDKLRQALRVIEDHDRRVKDANGGAEGHWEQDEESGAMASTGRGIAIPLILEGSEADIVERSAAFAIDFFSPLWKAQIQALERKRQDLQRKSGFNTWKSRDGGRQSSANDNNWRGTS